MLNLQKGTSLEVPFCIRQLHIELQTDPYFQIIFLRELLPLMINVLFGTVSIE